MIASKAKKLIPLYIASFLAVGIAIVCGGAVYADVHSDAKNSAEAAAPGLCATYVRLTLWANGSSVGNNHSMSVTINDPTADSVTLYLHRAGYKCESSGGSSGMGAKNIEISVEGGGLSVSGVSGGCLMFGETPDDLGVGKYYDADKTFSFKLNGLRSLPYGESNSTLHVFRYNGGRCKDGDNGDGSSGTEKITLTIYRQEPSWSITPDIEVSSATAAPGARVTWTGWLQASGDPTGETSWSLTDNSSNGVTNGDHFTDTTCSKVSLGNNAKSINCTSTQTIPANARHGDQYCMATRITSSFNNGSGGRRQSNQKCVTVAYNWRVDPTTTIRKSTGAYGNADIANARPGETIQWQHRAQQMGPTKTDKKVNFATVRTNGWTNGGSAGSWDTPRAKDNGSVVIKTESRTISQGDVDKTFCSQLTATPGGGGTFSANARTSTSRCATVPYHYPGCVGECTPPCHTDCTPGTVLNDNSGVSPKTSVLNNATGVIVPGESVKFGYDLTNRGPTKTMPTSYRTYTFVLPSGRNINSTLISGSHWYSGSRANFINASCSSRAGTTTNNCTVGVNRYGVEINFPSNFSQVTNTYTWDVNVGDRICSYIAVSPWSVVNGAISAGVSASNIECVTVARSPQINIRGSDSSSGADYWGDSSGAAECGRTAQAPCKLPSGTRGGFKSNPNLFNNRGSWSQYGLLSNGPVSYFGSAGQTYGGSVASACRLTFANVQNIGGSINCTSTASTGNFGHTGRTISLPEAGILGTPAYNNLKKVNAGWIASRPVINLNNYGDYNSLRQYASIPVSSDTEYHPERYLIENPTSQRAGFVVINTSTLPAYSDVVVVVKNLNVYIAGNITTNNTFNSLREIPNLTIVADNIYVDDSVTQLFGNYIANNAFYSCRITIDIVASEANFRENGGECSKQLTITGSLITRNSPRLQRTIGGGRNDPTVPAEIFNYTPNAFLTPWTNSGFGSGDWVTKTETVLPARF